MKKTICVLLIAVWCCAPAWADTQTAEQTATRLGLQAQQMVAMGVPPEAAAKMQMHFQERQMVQARTIVQKAKQQHLPLGPVVDKALEGIAKRAAARNVVNAMEQVRGRYAEAMAQAQDMTQDRSRQQTMTRAMAHAMAAGMPPEQVSSIMASVRSRQRSMVQAQFENLAVETCRAMRDMARMGASPEEVKETLGVALQNKYTAMQMNQLRSQFMNQARNTPPDVVALQFQAQVRAGGDIGHQGAGGAGSPGPGSGAAGNGPGEGSGDSGGGQGSGGGGGGGSNGGGGTGGRN